MPSNKKKKKKHDPVNSPSHYADGKFEVIDVMQDKMTPEQFRGLLMGNVLKYVMRADKKGSPNQDLRKGAWYLQKLIVNTPA